MTNAYATSVLPRHRRAAGDGTPESPTSRSPLVTTPSSTTATVQPPPLAWEPRLLERFAKALATAGLAGESDNGRLLYLAVPSRLLDKIVSVAVKGPSSGGKSYLVERVLAFFPASAYHALTAMSEHALAYDTEPLQHRMLVLYEAAGLTSDIATYMVRSLLSEGRVRYVTVEKVKGGGLQPRTIVREGPTGLIVTTTQVKLHPENETRLLSLTVIDTQDQTRQVLRAQAIESGAMLDPEPWHALQDWLAEQDNRVTIPYASTLAEQIPPVAVRLRRDFGAVLTLIRAHTVLQQVQRERDADGRIIATVEDYRVVRDLVGELVAEAAERTVPDTVRETVEAVDGLTGTGDGGEASVVQVADHLKLDKSAASRRVRMALERGYLHNREEKRGRPLRHQPRSRRAGPRHGGR